jgi:HPt (histidine-containing phosphotransfer) domain-containing protein
MRRAPSSPMDPKELKRRLGAMHASYRVNAPAKIAQIDALWLRVKAASPADAVRNELLLAAHTLVGSAPTLGCEPLGVAAGELELALRKAYSRDGPMSAEEVAAIGRLVANLGQSLG